MKRLTPRLTFFIGFLSIACLLCTAYFLEKVEGMTPCALCLFQRYIMVVLAALFFAGIFLSGHLITRRLLAALGTCTALAGLVFAGRQVWLQHLPPVQNGDCSANLDYMLQVMPVIDVIKKVYIGGVECSEVNWQFLQLSLAGWSCLVFIGLLLVSLWQLLRSK